jgi:hypothetical protein
MARNPNLTRTSKGVLVDGQFHETPTTPVGGVPYRQTNSGYEARRNDSKVVATPRIAHGMKNVGAKNHPLAFDGARLPLEDEPLQKTWNNSKSVPIHDGMGTKSEPHTRGIVAHVEDGSKHLRQASRSNFYERQASGHDDSLIGHRVSKTAALPTNKRRLDQ